MPRLLPLFALLLLTACEGVTKFSGAINVGTTPSTVAGAVSIVHLTVVSNGNGTSVNVTVVTLVQPGMMSNTMDFCGNQVSQFPMNANVTVQFIPGTPCNNVVKVTQM